ncbi:MAG: polyhydroxyalkanoate depolymerase, partial [Burkholderiaceae bacterium]|nr:polyhydroxyalkanoate depolymerase [Burkholderiaceae bacterium]
DKHLTSHYDYFKDLVKGDRESSDAHRKFYDEYNAVLDMDADYYLETIQTVFREFKLVNGTWDVKNPQGVPERVRPQDITTTALLSVEGEFDDISGAGQSEAAHGMCTGIPDSMCLHYEAKGAGHYGIFSGRRWRENVYPVVKQFIRDHSLTAPSKTAATLPAAAPEVATPAQVSPVADTLAPPTMAVPVAATKAQPAQPTSAKPRATRKPKAAAVVAAASPVAKIASPAPAIAVAPPTTAADVAPVATPAAVVADAVDAVDSAGLAVTTAVNTPAQAPSLKS